MKIVKVISAVTVLTAFTSCAVVRPGEVGVKQKLGKLSEKFMHKALFGSTHLLLKL